MIYKMVLYRRIAFSFILGQCSYRVLLSPFLIHWTYFNYLPHLFHSFFLKAAWLWNSFTSQEQEISTTNLKTSKQTKNIASNLKQHLQKASRPQILQIYQIQCFQKQVEAMDTHISPSSHYIISSFFKVHKATVLIH